MKTGYSNLLRRKMNDLVERINNSVTDPDLSPDSQQFVKKMRKFKDKYGEALLWKGEDGNAGASFMADWLENADVLGEIETIGYAGLFEAMLSGIMVRPKFGTHPRLKILGPIEARLSQFDVMIIGEVNEGVWPKLASSDPWMSRPMKKDFGSWK